MTEATGRQSVGWEETLDTRRDEVASKLERVRRLMTERGVEAVLLRRLANTAWLTAGAATYVNESVDEAACSVLVTQRDARILTDPIEAPRLLDEERIEDLGFTVEVARWYASGPDLSGASTSLAADNAGVMGAVDLSSDFVRLRSILTLAEQARLREGARRAATAMRAATDAARPGLRELDLAAELAAASRRQGGTATVTLVGADQRILRYRHPLPTEARLERYAMLVLCFRYRGLVTALTRSLYFGEIPPALLETARAVARIDAEVIAATQPGRTLGEMFETLRELYTRVRQPDAIEQHHQGGTIAYLARENLARPDDPTPIEVGQAFAWNPSLRGAKSEDTVLLTDRGPEVVSATPGWPEWRIATELGEFARPAILQLDPTS